MANEQIPKVIEMWECDNLDSRNFVTMEYWWKMDGGSMEHIWWIVSENIKTQLIVFQFSNTYANGQTTCWRLQMRIKLSRHTLKFRKKKNPKRWFNFQKYVGKNLKNEMHMV